MISDFLIGSNLSSRRSAGFVVRVFVLVLMLGAVALPRVGWAQTAAEVPEQQPTSMEPANPKLPTIWVVGDSTAAFHTPTNEGELAAQGWGPFFSPYFDLTKVNVMNVSKGGRSTRTYRSEGWWEKVLPQVKKGDVVLIQMGQNDVFELNDRIARGTIPGVSDDVQEIDNQVTKQHEVVHTFGWYLAQYVKETKAKGALPILLTFTPRDKWISDTQLERGTPGYREWTWTIAQQEHVDFLDMTEIIAEVYDGMPHDKVAALYHAKEPVHADWAGAELNAKLTVAGLKAMPGAPVTKYLSAKGKAVPAAVQKEKLAAAAK
jgi:lysophospholipase L1-like esterase